MVIGAIVVDDFFFASALLSNDRLILRDPLRSFFNGKNPQNFM